MRKEDGKAGEREGLGRKKVAFGWECISCVRKSVDVLLCLKFRRTWDEILCAAEKQARDAKIASQIAADAANFREVPVRPAATSLTFCPPPPRLQPSLDGQRRFKRD